MVSSSISIDSDLAPVDFTVAMAQGWHNLPMLYGQKVRRVDPITDFTSGMKTGSKVSTSHVSCNSRKWDLDFMTD